MKLQQIYDEMMDKMRAQGKKATDSYGMCQYQTPEGLHCVVGCMLPDSLLSGREDDMRGKSVGFLPADILDYLTETLAEGDREALNFYRHCQMAHDNGAVDAKWARAFEQNMQNVALIFDLTYTPAEKK